MKKYLFVCIVLAGVSIEADVTMHKRPIFQRPVHPIEPEKPDNRPIAHPIVVPHVDTAYINNTYVTQESCESYKQHIDELNAYIDTLEKEIHDLKEKEYAKLREKLKKEHVQELRQFEKRKSSVKSENRIIVKEKAQ